MYQCDNYIGFFVKFKLNITKYTCKMAGINIFYWLCLVPLILQTSPLAIKLTLEASGEVYTGEVFRGSDGKNCDDI